MSARIPLSEEERNTFTDCSSHSGPNATSGDVQSFAGLEGEADISRLRAKRKSTVEGTAIDPPSKFRDFAAA